MYTNAPNRNPFANVGVLLVGIGVCAVWAWSAYPSTVRNLIDRATGADYVLLAGFAIAGLVVIAMLSNLVQALVGLVALIVRIGVVLLVVWGVVAGWRTYAGREHRPSDARVPLTYAAASPPEIDEVPAEPAPSIDPDERRRELENELHRLDSEQGKAWWEAK